jgi:hypothetical protein
VENKFRSDTEGFPVSRDWEEIPCKQSSCKWNRFGSCTVPSFCKIGEDGKCMGYERRD